ncbi:MAG TPA: L,D-transpeptidase family protein [Pyrinomonadaceae bacterium]
MERRNKKKLKPTRLVSVLCLLFISTAFCNAQQKPALLTRAEIKTTEQTLASLGYWTGPIDGVFDETSRSALIAFQKWEGRAITNKLTREELAAIEVASAPKARELGYEHVEIDIDRQVLLIVSDSGAVKVLPVSTGSGKTFFDEDSNSVSYTPRGRFIVYEKHVGWEYGPLGSLYYANFISGGVAIHGSKTVPTTPESHGCIRIPVFAAREVSKTMPLGTIVLVYDKVSFVSALDWIKNPRLKPSADIE